MAKIKHILLALIALIGVGIPFSALAVTGHQTAPAASDANEKPLAKKVLFIGDSMTGWMAERLNAYGKANDFEVATVIWDGSTIAKWGANSAKLTQYVNQIKPDAVFISLGLNELAEKNPEARLAGSLAKIEKAIGNTPIIWVGPPTWPGKPWGEPLNSWLSEKLGKDHYYSSLHLKLGRQSATNPHPSRDGINHWIDSLMTWLPAHGAIRLPGYTTPSTHFSRPSTYIYRKMNQSL